MKYNHRQDWQWAFIDMLLLMVGLFSALYIVTLLQVQPPRQNEGVEMKAELVVVMTWPEQSFDDVDMHMLLPDQTMLNFRNKDTPYATLDRDDRGAEGDVIMGEDGKLKINPRNQEVITIRSTVPGTYYINLHMFRARDHMNVNGERVVPTNPLPFNVNVSVKKLNPRYTEVAEVNILLEEVGQQKTALAITIGEGGEVVRVDTNVDMPFIPTKPLTELP